MLTAVAAPRRRKPRRSAPGPRAGTVLVTGATGLLGTALCARLLAAGRRVIPNARNAPPFFRLDEPDSIAPAVCALRPAWIVHAAANTSVEACEADPAAARRLHVESSAALARAAREAGSRLIFVSTAAVYDGEGEQPHREEEALRPLNHYARSKFEGEEACRRELPATVIARVNFYGLHPVRRTGLATWIIDSLRAGRPIAAFTDVLFNPLLNHELTDLLLALMDREVPGGIYNLGASDSCSQFAFARRIALRLGVDPQLIRPATQADAALPTPRPRCMVMAVEKVTRALGRELPTIDDGLAGLMASVLP